MPTKKKADIAHYLELLDRLYIQMNLMDAHMLRHPVAEKDQEIRESLLKALYELHKTYQLAYNHVVVKKKK
jgi:hypothetical protein